jgi:ribosomal protein S18 acetylase RimI-like enzyme
LGQSLVIESLRQDHGVEDFSCGVYDLDRWLKHSALDSQRAGWARVFVALNEGSSQVLGYFALSATSIKANDQLLPRSVSKKRDTPAFEIGKIAVHEQFHGQRVGTRLFLTALAYGVVGSTLVGSRAIVLHADTEELVSWYERFDFIRASEASRFMFMKVSEALQCLEREQLEYAAHATLRLVRARSHAS